MALVQVQVPVPVEVLLLHVVQILLLGWRLFATRVWLWLILYCHAVLCRAGSALPYTALVLSLSAL